MEIVIYILALIAVVIIIVIIAIKTNINDMRDSYKAQLKEMDSKHSTEMQNLIQELQDDIDEKKAHFQSERIDFLDDMDKKRARLELEKKEFYELIEKQKEYAPEMATMIADFLTIHYIQSADYLENKDHPAHIEAKRIRELKEETAEYITRMKVAEYKLESYKKRNKITESETINLLLEDTEITDETSNDIDEEKNLSPATNQTHQTSIFDIENANISNT